MSLKTKFCPKCGKETKQLIDGLCADCYVGETGAALPKSASIKVCKRCGATNLAGIWSVSEHPPEYYLEHILIPKLRLPPNADFESLHIIEIGKQGNVRATFTVGGKKFVQDLLVSLEVIKTVCPDCQRVGAKTHQGVLQVRAKAHAKTFVESVLKFSEKYKTVIIKAEAQRTGIDIYIASKDAARHLASELRKEFNLKMRETHEQYGWDKTRSQPKTRVTILLSQR